MKRVLVTGVTGKSGLFFLKECVAHADELKDYHFKLFVRPTSNTARIDEAAKVISLEKFTGDKSNSSDVDLFMQGDFDTLLHISSIRDSVLMVTSALNHGVSRLILVHTTGIYSKFKAASEEYKATEENIAKLLQKMGGGYLLQYSDPQ